MATKVGGRGVQSVEVGGRLLAVLAETAQPMMLRDLAGKASLTPAQAHAYLVSFRKLDLVEQDSGSGRYQLGPFALSLGLARMRGFDPLRHAGAAIVELADALGLMVTLSVWGTHGPTIVQVRESADQVHVNLRAGAVFTLTGTATGRIFAAYLPEKVVAPRVAAELRRGRRETAIGTPTSLAQLRRDVAEIRRLGFATAQGRPIPGINAIAAPVLDHHHELRFAVTVIGPAGRVGVAAGGAQAKALLAFAARLSAQIGGSP